MSKNRRCKRLVRGPGLPEPMVRLSTSRTGVISAVLLGILDVEEDLIVADYVATQENLDAIVERLMASRGYRNVLSALPPETLHADGETMISFLDRIRDRYGSMREYARTAGVGDETLERLRARLLEPAR